jgi:hypothetical protein
MLSHSNAVVQFQTSILFFALEKLFAAQCSQVERSFMRFVLFSVVFVVVSLNLVRTGISQQIDVAHKEAIERAVEKLKRVESIAAFSMHGTISFDQESHEVWIEGRGNKFWLKRKKMPKDKGEADAFSQRSEIVKSDLSELHVFDGKRMHTYVPSLLKLSIEEKENFKAPTGFASMLPQSWLNFTFTTQKPKIDFRAILTELLPECTVVKDRTHDGIRVTRKKDSTEEGKSVGHTSRHLVIEQASGLIKATDASGGAAFDVVSELSWKDSGSEIFISKCKITVGGRRVTEWSIDEFTVNPAKVRNSFSVDQKTLPLGTKIDIEPSSKQNKREVTYVGGSEGEREHTLKIEAIRLLAQKSQ